jgi:hypothetical protein
MKLTVGRNKRSVSGIRVAGNGLWPYPGLRICHLLALLGPFSLREKVRMRGFNNGQ